MLELVQRCLADEGRQESVVQLSIGLVGDLADAFLEDESSNIFSWSGFRRLGFQRHILREDEENNLVGERGKLASNQLRR